MITWILILVGHAGPFGTGNSISLASVPGFASQQECNAAGFAAAGLTDGSTKFIKFICVKQTKEIVSREKFR